MMNQKSFQDYYPDELSHCYGCGRLNEHGLKIKSYWDGQEAGCSSPDAGANEANRRHSLTS
jgi:hypothetical protein